MTESSANALSIAASGDDNERQHLSGPFPANALFKRAVEQLYGEARFASIEELQLSVGKYNRAWVPGHAEE